MLLLDCEAVSAIAHGPVVRRDRVRALIAEMHARGHSVGIAAAILAELIRDRPEDAGIFAGVNRERLEVHPVDRRIGIHAGRILGKAQAGSEMAVDAFQIAVLDVHGGGVLATSDPKDMRRLAAWSRNVLIADIT